ncbi:MAG: hypothetical protein J6S57_02090 [Alphaproteobacteria bacterium]|nr:hypothetical protein [Alphaproteobacteria bacterium]
MAENDRSIKKTLNFFCMSGQIYQKKCDFQLHNGVFDIYDCPAINQLFVTVTYGADNQVFVQAGHAGFEGDKTKALFNRNFLQSICKNCGTKDNNSR